MAREWLSVKQVADYTGFSVRTIYRFVEERRIPYYQVGGAGAALRFLKDEVDGWLTANRHEAYV